MADFSQDYPFGHELSLKPLIDFWRHKAAPQCPGAACTLGRCPRLFCFGPSGQCFVTTSAAP